MEFRRKYAAVAPGMHSPDERVYRAEHLRPCGNCGLMTAWTDVALGTPVCSEECQVWIATGRKMQPLVGQFLIKEGLITEEQLEETLRLQQTRDGYTPIGQLLVEQKLITTKQLDHVLDKYRKRPRLGRVLVAARVISEDQLRHAMVHQRNTAVRLGDALLQLRLATEAEIKQGICIQLNLPFIDLERFTPDRSSRLPSLVKRSYAEKHRVVPIARLGSCLTVAMDDPTDSEVIRMLEASTGLAVSVVTGTRAGLECALARVYD